LIETNDFRPGTAFEMDGKLLTIVNVEHIKMARAGAVIKAKLRNILDGSIYEQSFRSGEKYKTVRIDSSEAQYLYRDGDLFHFMDNTNYEQVALDLAMVADAVPFMKEGNSVRILRHEDRTIGVSMPITVELAVAETDPGHKGDTVSGSTKPATLETGATINVPLFINQGDVLKVDTRTGNYIERV
jgi:elongation factor P